MRLNTYRVTAVNYAAIAASKLLCDTARGACQKHIMASQAGASVKYIDTVIWCM